MNDSEVERRRSVPRARPAFIAGVLVVGGAAGCRFGNEANFVGPRVLDTCDLEVPVCNTTAGCKLVEEQRYLEGEFPGQRSWIVPTDGEATIRLSILWRTQLGPGADTEILWHEPACVDTYRFESQGRDVFADSNAQGVFIKEQKVFREGEHLIELRSDATAEYVLRTDVLTDAELEAEARSGSPLGG
jgi:hypothetical protein